MTTGNEANGLFKFGWVIRVLVKDVGLGLVIEDADLGNGKHMVVATDTAKPIAEGVFRQAGFGPYVFKEGTSIDWAIDVLKSGLLAQRKEAEAND